MKMIFLAQISLRCTNATISKHFTTNVLSNAQDVYYLSTHQTIQSIYFAGSISVDFNGTHKCIFAVKCYGILSHTPIRKLFQIFLFAKQNTGEIE